MIERRWDRVMTRCITRSMPVPGATIRVTPGDLERMPAAASAARAGRRMAAELLRRVRAELPAVSGLGERDQVLVSAWLTGLRSARTRRAYAGDVAAWLGWLAEQEQIFFFFFFFLRDQARALVATADADTGAQALRTAAVVRLLLHNALRVDEACAADVADLGEDRGHQVLRVVRKGARKAKIPLTPATVAALEAYLAAGRNGPGRGSGGS